MAIQNDVLKELNEVYNRDFTGWDFSSLEGWGVMKEFPLEWEYKEVLTPYLSGRESMLDMGTGGGEFLSSLAPLPEVTVATEGWEPNFPVAKNRLEPLGVEVVWNEEDSQLPFSDSSFELIINKHESFCPAEVNRTLKGEGIFVTQQVGHLNDREFTDLFKLESTEKFVWDLEKAISQVEKNNFKVLFKKENITKTRFYTTGAIVYYLKAIPWLVPDFSVDRYIEELSHIHDVIEREGYIDFTCHRFVLVAQKNS